MRDYIILLAFMAGPIFVLCFVVAHYVAQWSAKRHYDQRYDRYRKSRYYKKSDGC